MAQAPLRAVGPALLLLAVAAIAACGGASATPVPPVVTAAPPTAAPATEPPAPAASEAPAGGAVEPSEKLITTDGRVIAYPPGWWTKEDLGIVYVASGEDAANALVTTGALGPGAAYVQFGQNSILSGGTADPAVHLPEYVKMLVEGQSMKAGTPASTTVGGLPAATLTAANDRLHMLAVSVKVRDDLFADVIAYGAPGEEAALQALVMKMLEGSTYPPA